MAERNLLRRLNTNKLDLDKSDEEECSRYRNPPWQRRIVKWLDTYYLKRKNKEK